VEIQFPSRAKPCDIFKRHSVNATGFYPNRPLSVSLQTAPYSFLFWYYSFQKNKGPKTGNHQTNKCTVEEMERIWQKIRFFKAQITCHGPHGWSPTSNRGFPLSSPYHFHVGFVVNKVVLKGSSPSTSVFSCQHHSPSAPYPFLSSRLLVTESEVFGSPKSVMLFRKFGSNTK
jgi:hypothetical protein